MKPIGLTMKPGRNKYQRHALGELMLVHECTGCKTLSINRIAADDDSGTVMAVFQASLALGQRAETLCQGYGIAMLKAEDVKRVQSQLYGISAGGPALGWS
jgi:hypothetical protein